MNAENDGRNDARKVRTVSGSDCPDFPAKPAVGTVAQPPPAVKVYTAEGRCATTPPPAVKVHTAEGRCATTAPRPGSEGESPVLAQLLEIADGYLAAGAVHQAMEIYLELAGQHSDAPEGARALLRLLEIAEQFAHAGKLHQARALYERLV